MKIQRATALAALAALACLSLTVSSAWAAPKPHMSTPVLSCGGSTEASIDVMICAGATGAPAGFSLHWLPDADFQDLYGGVWPDSSTPGFCHASFSGNAAGGFFSLGPNQCMTINIGDNLFDTPGASSNCASVPLACGTDYVFRTFAHANSSFQRSAFSANQVCGTAGCDSCTFTQGYWKTHGPIPTGNNSNEWPVTGLTLGTISYTDLELQAIFDTPAAGNGLVSLAHQLIAAKLNVANGVDDSAVAGAIAAADALIGGLVVPPVGTGSLPSSSTSALTSTLTLFNEGAIGPGHCG